MKKKKFSWKGFSWLLAVVVVILGVLYPHYIWTVERAKAGSAEAVLMNLAIAENLYFIHHQTYTEDWRALEPYFSKTPSIQGFFAPAAEPGEERFFAFSKPDLETAHNGFSFGIELNEDGSSGKLYAVRVGGVFQYMLGEAFPKPVFVCDPEGLGAKWFCKKFTVYVEPFLMRRIADQNNGLPVSESEQEAADPQPMAETDTLPQ